IADVVRSIEIRCSNPIAGFGLVVDVAAPDLRNLAESGLERAADWSDDRPSDKCSFKGMRESEAYRSSHETRNCMRNSNDHRGENQCQRRIVEHCRSRDEAGANGGDDFFGWNAVG